MGKDMILTINPGTTTTRIGLFLPQRGQVQSLLEETVEHDETVMAGFDTIAAQLDHRTAALRAFLDTVPGGVRLAAVAGRDAVPGACGGDRGECRSGGLRAA